LILLRIILATRVIRSAIINESGLFCPIPGFSLPRRAMSGVSMIYPLVCPHDAWLIPVCVCAIDWAWFGANFRPNFGPNLGLSLGLVFGHEGTEFCGIPLYPCDYRAGPIIGCILGLLDGSLASIS
jgi:hypothetical protein